MVSPHRDLQTSLPLGVRVGRHAWAWQGGTCLVTCRPAVTSCVTGQRPERRDTRDASRRQGVFEDVDRSGLCVVSGGLWGSVVPSGHRDARHHPLADCRGAPGSRCRLGRCLRGRSQHPVGDGPSVSPGDTALTGRECAHRGQAQGGLPVPELPL